MDQKTMIEKIQTMKREKNAIILAHYYQEGIIQDIADHTGDSYQLSRIASETDADMIVFCGVRFMAETAKVLSPEKTVLLPVLDAGCPMADMIDADTVRSLRKDYPKHVFVCYVNSSVEVKAECDVCVTSSNAAKVVSHFADKPIFYLPDKNLGTYLKSEKQWNIDVFDGYCNIHNNLTLEDVREKRAQYPDALVIVHPEAPLAVIQAADFVGSTSALLEFVKNNDANRFIVGTEKGICHKMRLNRPQAEFILLNDDLVCEDMKKTSLEALFEGLLKEKHKIEINETIRTRAAVTLNRMLDLSKTTHAR